MTADAFPWQHFHPHGIEYALVLVGVALLAGTIAFLFMERTSR